MEPRIAYGTLTLAVALTLSVTSGAQHSVSPLDCSVITESWNALREKHKNQLFSAAHLAERPAFKDRISTTFFSEVPDASCGVNRLGDAFCAAGCRAWGDAYGCAKNEECECWAGDGYTRVMYGVFECPVPEPNWAAMLMLTSGIDRWWLATSEDAQRRALQSVADSLGWSVKVAVEKKVNK